CFPIPQRALSWWNDTEYKKTDDALGEHARALHTKSGLPGQFDAGDAAPQAAGGGRGNAPAAGGGRGGRGGGGGGGPRSTGPIGSNEELSGVGPAGNAVLMDALRAAM